MTNLIKSPYFGILLSLLAYILALKISKKVKSPLANPLLLSLIFVMAFLKIFNISYTDYNNGGKYISFLIAPATVAMVINLYKNFDLFKKNAFPIFMGILAGVITSVLSAYLLSTAFGLSPELKISMIPKSLTTAIASAVAEEYGGIVPITIIGVMVSGIGGAVIAPSVIKLFRIKDPVAQGVCIGTSSHAAGTSKAIEMGEIQGAMSGLAIALAGFISVILIPIILAIF